MKVPLAVTFPKAPGKPEAAADNRYGAKQGRCNGCGDCVIGCSLHAKNTLDLNYLAQLENVAKDRDGANIAQVWTMAEVTRIAENGDGTFTVHVTRHDQGERATELQADYVFRVRVPSALPSC